MRHMAQPFHINDFHAAAGKAGNDGFLFEVLDCPRQCSAMDAEHGSELFLRHAEREIIGTPSRLREMRKRLKRVTKSSMSMSVRYVW